MKKTFILFVSLCLALVSGFAQLPRIPKLPSAPKVPVTPKVPGPGSYHAARSKDAKVNNILSRYYSATDGNNYTQSEEPSGELHKNNFDKIVFGKARIDKNAGNAQVSNTFQAGESIYGRAFMRTCMMNYKVYGTEMNTQPYKCMEGRFEVNLYVDGQDKGVFMSNSLDGELEDKTSFTIIVVGTGDDSQANNEEFIKTLNGLSTGSHTIKLVVWATQGQFISVDPVAIGEFTYVKGAGASNVGLGRNFSAVNDAMPDNAALKAKFLKKLNEHAKVNAWKETFTEVKITDEDWTTLRNELTSVITGRLINIAAKATWPDGHCTYQTFSMYSDYDGAAYSNAVSLRGIGDQIKIDCK